MSRRQAAADPAPEAARANRWLGPKVLLAAIGFLAVALIAMGAFAVMAIGDEGEPYEITTCVVGEDAGCTLRQPIHEHANFAVVIRGETFDFSQEQFVTRTGEEENPVVHIHPERYGVVHVHLSGTSWSEFLRTVDFELNDPSLAGTTVDTTSMTLPDGTKLGTTENERWRFFVNGVEVDGVALTTIYDLDRVLMTYGDETEEEIVAQVAAVGDDACIPSERCKERIPADEPPEECTITNDTCAR